MEKVDENIMNYNCLIVDDEEMLAEAICEYFNAFDIITKYLTSSDECIKFLHENTVDVILLDINLGEKSGFDLCKNIREITNVPILFVSARQNDDDILMALNIGGDDYIKKPCSMSVLLAKVKAVLKRYKSNAEENNLLKENNLTIDYNAQKVFIDGKEVKFRTFEFKLLYYLVKNKNRVIPKRELFQNVWGDSCYSDGTLNVHIRKVREKIEKDPNAPKYLKTIWGTGYIFENNEI